MEKEAVAWILGGFVLVYLVIRAGVAGGVRDALRERDRTRPK